MARITFIVALIVVSIAACSGQRLFPGQRPFPAQRPNLLPNFNFQQPSRFNIPRSRSGKPFGVNVGRDYEVFPDYSRGTFSLGVKYRGNAELTVGYNPGADQYRAGLSFRFRRDADTGINEVTVTIFKELDVNEDGKIDVSEWILEDGKVVPFATLLMDHDTNGDEKISFEEFSTVDFLPGLLQAKPEVPGVPDEE